MLTRKAKIIIFLLLLLIGAALLIYGFCFHSATILPKQQDDLTVLVQSEPALIKEVSVGGIERDDSGVIRRTYDKSPPLICPT